MLPTDDPITLAIGAVYVALILLVGYAVLCLALEPGVRHWVELISLCFAAGAGVLPLLLFAISVAGCKPNRPILIAIAIVALSIILMKWKRRAILQPSVPTRRHKIDAVSFLGFLGAGLIAMAGCNIAANAAWPGLQDIDAFAIWLLKAKWVTLDALRPMPAVFHDPILSYSHQDYPLCLPFLVAGFYAALGHIDDTAAKVLLLPIWISLTGIVYSTIRRFHRRAGAVAITAVFATAPTLTHNAAVLVAETSLLLAFAGAASQLLIWMEDGEPGNLPLAALFAAVAAFTKNEGLAMLPIFTVAALLVCIKQNLQTPVRSGSSAHRRTGVCIRAVLLCAIAIIPWLLYRALLPKTHEDYGSKLLRPAIVFHNLHQRTGVFTDYLARFFDAPRVGLIWYLLIFSAILARRALGRTSVQILWFILLIQLSLYLVTFIVTPWDVQVLIPMVTPKLQTQASVVAALLIALNLHDMNWSSK